MSEIEEQLDHSIEEIEEIMEEEAVDSHTTHERWVSLVALSSTIMAVLAAIMALLATVASDEAFIKESKEGVDLAYLETKRVNYNILKYKQDVLLALGKSMEQDEADLLNRYEQEIIVLKKKFESEAEATDHLFATHDLFAIAITLTQVAIAIGGIAVIIRHQNIWRFSLFFGVLGAVFGCWGGLIW